MPLNMFWEILAKLLVHLSLPGEARLQHIGDCSHSFQISRSVDLAVIAPEPPSRILRPHAYAYSFDLDMRL